MHNLNIRWPLQRTTHHTEAAKTSGCGGNDIDRHLDLEVFKEHLGFRQIILNRAIDHTAVERVVMQIEKFNFEDDENEDSKSFDRTATPITLYINSPGGYVSDGLAIVSAIEQSRTPIVTVAQGMAASCAFLVLISGHARFAYRHARLMYHQAWGGDFGKINERAESLEESMRLQERIDEIILRRTHLTAKQLKEIHERKQDWYLWPEEAAKFGIIDGIPSVGLPIPKMPIEHYTKLAEAIHLAKKAETEVPKVKKARKRKVTEEKINAT